MSTYSYQTEVCLQLSATIHRQTPEAEVGEKGKRSLFQCCTVWENGRLVSQSPSPPEETPAALSQTKLKVVSAVSRQCHSPLPSLRVILLLHHMVLFKVPFLGNHRQPLSGHVGSSALCPATVRPQSSILTDTGGASATTGHVAYRARS